MEPTRLNSNERREEESKPKEAEAMKNSLDSGSRDKRPAHQSLGSSHMTTNEEGYSPGQNPLPTGVQAAKVQVKNGENECVEITAYDQRQPAEFDIAKHT